MPNGPSMFLRINVTNRVLFNTQKLLFKLFSLPMQFIHVISKVRSLFLPGMMDYDVVCSNSGWIW
jgi:hypothetical protein